jgi:hypothetical protein
MSKKAVKDAMLLTTFVRRNFDFNGKNLAESHVRSLEDHVELMHRLIDMFGSNKLGDVTEGIRPPRLVICDLKDFGPSSSSSKEILEKALVIVTDTDDINIKTIEIFDPSLEGDLVKIAKKFKQKYLRQYPNLVINLSITPRPKQVPI